MRFFWTFFWGFLLAQMLTYVVSSMIGVEYNFATGTTLAVVFSILVIVITFIIPNEPVNHHSSH